VSGRYDDTGLRDQLAEALNEEHGYCDEFTPGDDDSGCPDCDDFYRMVDTLLPAVYAYAEHRARAYAAQELRAAADTTWRWGSPVDRATARMLNQRADALEAAAHNEGDRYLAADTTNPP